jgi:hypothetical protein
MKASDDEAQAAAPLVAHDCTVRFEGWTYLVPLSFDVRS